MPARDRRRRAARLAATLILLTLSATSPVRAGDGPRTFTPPDPARGGWVQTGLKRLLHRDVARPLYIGGYAGYNYAGAPRSRPAPAAVARRPGRGLLGRLARRS